MGESAEKLAGVAQPASAPGREAKQPKLRVVIIAFGHSVLQEQHSKVTRRD